MARTAIQVLNDRQLTSPPSWLPENTHYLCMMGSVAYGASGDTSDMDIYGWAIPPKRIIFPHIDGHIRGFGVPPENFEIYQQHHVKDGTQEYDFAIYSIVKFFDLAMQNNPNMVDALFVPERCILHETKIAQMVRVNRRMFLHRGSYAKFNGYARAQLRKLEGKTNSTNPKRAESIEKFGWDVKFGYHLTRLADECEQILLTGDLDITRGREMFKSIRRGEWTLQQVKDWFERKMQILDQAFLDSKLPDQPPVEKIKMLLIQCLEEHYGSLSNLVKVDKESNLLGELRALVERYDR